MDHRPYCTLKDDLQLFYIGYPPNLLLHNPRFYGIPPGPARGKLPNSSVQRCPCWQAWDRLQLRATMCSLEPSRNPSRSPRPILMRRRVQSPTTTRRLVPRLPNFPPKPRRSDVCKRMWNPQHCALPMLQGLYRFKSCTQIGINVEHFIAIGVAPQVSKWGMMIYHLPLSDMVGCHPCPGLDP